MFKKIDNIEIVLEEINTLTDEEIAILKELTLLMKDAEEWEALHKKSIKLKIMFIICKIIDFLFLFQMCFMIWMYILVQRGTLPVVITLCVINRIVAYFFNQNYIDKLREDSQILYETACQNNSKRDQIYDDMKKNNRTVEGDFDILESIIMPKVFEYLEKENI